MPTMNDKAEETLRKSEKKIQAILDASPDVIHLLDINGIILSTNKSYAKRLGLEIDDIVGKCVFDYTSLKSIPGRKAALDKVFRTGEPLQFEDKDTTGIFESHLHPVFNPEGEITAVAVYARDITRRKQAEKALHIEIDNLNNIFDAMGDGIYIVNQEYDIQYVNEVLKKLFGIYEGRKCYEYFHDRTEVCPWCKNPEVFAGKTVRWEWYSFKTQRTYDLIDTPLKNPDGSISKLEIFRDITERKQAEEALQKSKETTEKYLNVAAELIITLDSKGIITLLNESGHVLLGYRTGELIGRNWFDTCLPVQMKKEVREVFKKLMREETKNIETYENQVLTKNDEEKTIRWHNTLLRDDEGRITGILSSGENITEHKKAEKATQQYIRRLDALRKIDQAITGNLDLKVTLSVFLNHLLTQLEIDTAAVLLYKKDLQTLIFSRGQGFRTTALRYTNLRLGQGHAGKVALQKRHIFIPDLNQPESGILESPVFKEEGFVAYYGVPLIAKGILVGVLEIFHRSVLNPDNEWVNYLKLLADQAAIAIDNTILFKDLQHSNVELVQAYDATIEGWARAMELRDMETEGHSRRVVDITMDLSQRLGISEEKLVHIRRGTLLHDIGKMGVPDAILQKPGKLTNEEWQIMQQHPVYAYKWLSPIEYLRPALDIPYCHHEKWDGTGYPRGLRGEQIPLAARIFAIVDVWDALLSDRPYRKAWPRKKALAYIQEQSGKHFDPQVVTLFLEHIRSQ